MLGVAPDRARRGRTLVAAAPYTRVSSVRACCSPGHELPQLGQAVWVSLVTGDKHSCPVLGRWHEGTAEASVPEVTC